MIKAIIMDMDGTLLDSEPIHTKAFQGFLDELGVEGSLDEEKDIVGYDLATICRNCIRRFHIDLSEEDYKRRQHDYTYRLFGQEELLETPGLTKFLQEIKARDMKTAVASATHSEIVDLILRRLGIRDLIDVICGVESVQNTKPAPDLFYKAAAELGVSPEDCLVIEDSPAGILAAQAAGMRSVAISCHTGAPDEAASADLVVHDFTELKLDDSAFSIHLFS